MKTVEWLARVSPKWVGGWISAQAARAVVAGPVPVSGRRTTSQRLAARSAEEGEGLAPRELRAMLEALRAVVDTGVSEVEAGRRAQRIAQRYREGEPAHRLDIALLMSEQFAPDAQRLEHARQALEAVLGSSDSGAAEVRLRRALQTPRRRLLKRFAAFPDGLRFLVDLRTDVLGWLRQDRRLMALDGELEILLSTWFDVGFLELRQLTWDSPASLLEKLILYEAVHDIRSWSDLKNRLDSDRRCYAFFHPRLPDEPLIFVEVAFANRLADNIAALLDESAPKVDPTRASTAIFYSISSTQPGLKGVNFGDSLLKRVVEALQEDFPKLRHFATLSPIPGLALWLRHHLSTALDAWPERHRKALRAAATELLGTNDEPVADPQAAEPLATLLLRAFERVHLAPADHPVALCLRRLAARYLARELESGRPVDPVARFHLGNGARVERLHHAADLSAKGLKRSHGLMVNYLYDPRRVDKHRNMLASGEIPASREVEELCNG